MKKAALMPSRISGILAILFFAISLANAQGNFKGYKAVVYTGTASSPSFSGNSDVELDIETIDDRGNVSGTLTLTGKSALVWNVRGKIDSAGALRLSGQNDFRFDFTGKRQGNTITGDFTITAANGKRSGKINVTSNSSDYSSGDSGSGVSDSDVGSSEPNQFSNESNVPNCSSGVFSGDSTGVFQKKKISVKLEFIKYTTVENSEVSVSLSGGINDSANFFGQWENSTRMRLTGTLAGKPTSMFLNFAGSSISGNYSIKRFEGNINGNFKVGCAGGSPKVSNNSGSDDDTPVSSSSGDDDSGSSSSSSSSGSSSSGSKGDNNYSTDFDTSADFEPCESGEYRSSSPVVTIRVSDYRTVENSEITIDLSHKYGGNGIFWGTWTAKPRMKLTGKLDGRPTSIDATFAGKKVSGRYSIAHMNGPTVGNFVATCVQ